MVSCLRTVTRLGLVGVVVAGIAGGALAKKPAKTVQLPENTLWGVHIKETYQDILRKYGQPDELQAGGPYYPTSAEVASKAPVGNAAPMGAGGPGGYGGSMPGGMGGGMMGARPTGLTGAFGGSGGGSGSGMGGASKSAFPYARACRGTTVLPKWSKIPRNIGYPNYIAIQKCKKAQGAGGYGGSGGSGSSGYSGYGGGSGGQMPAGYPGGAGSLGADGSEDPSMAGMDKGGSGGPMSYGSGMSGSGMGSSGMGGPGGMGGGASQGPPEQTTLVEEPPQVVSTWWYHRPKLGLYFCFSFDRMGKVIQVQEFGASGGSSTKRGIALGSSLGQVLKQYGWDNNGAHNDDNLVMSFMTRNINNGDDYTLAFQIQKQRIVAIGIALSK